MKDFIKLHNEDGENVYVDTCTMTNIVPLVGGIAICHPNCRTSVVTGNSSVSVRETPDEVIALYAKAINGSVEDCAASAEDEDKPSKTDNTGDAEPLYCTPYKTSTLAKVVIAKEDYNEGDKKQFTWYEA